MLIETERHGSHVMLTLNRPERLNALNYALIDEGLAIEAAQFMIAAASPDAREGTAAFVEKRPPVFLHR